MKGYCFFVFVFCFFITQQTSYGQNYGLGFASYDVQKDSRTGLNLTPDKPFSFTTDFELSFHLGLYSRKQIFGYVLRAIINDTLNIDIQLNYDVKGTGVISVIAGQQIYNFPSWIIDQKLFSGGEEVRIKFCLKDNKLTLFKEDKNNSINIRFPEKVFVSFTFGAGNTNRFITTDVPSMELKDIRLYRKDKLFRHWPLDESNGTQATDNIEQAKAEVANPLWIKPGFSQWQLNRKFVFPGIAVSAFNEAKDEMYFLTKDSLVIYSLVSHKIKSISFAGDSQVVNLDSRLIIDYHTNNLYHYYLDTRDFIRFDTLTGQWSHKLSKGSRSVRNFTQHNSFFSKRDSSFYFFGGYGFYKYKSNLFRYHIPNHEFSEIIPKGDIIRPRYLSALGFTENADSVYLLGGYGSVSGDQRINPQNYKDLYLLDISKGKSKSICNFNALPDDYCFARSLILSPERKAFYALCFAKHKYKTWLKLLKGDVRTGDFDMMGDSIPYLFEDTRSSEDLFFSKNGKVLVSTTSVFDENSDSSYIDIYTIRFPPNFSSLNNKHPKNDRKNLFAIISTLVFMAAVAMILGIVKKSRKGKIKEEIREPQTMTNSIPVISDVRSNAENKTVNAIAFFGGFHIYDKEGFDISNNFSPLLKELFLLIFFNSQNEKKGISSEMLTQILWYDKSSDQARNNRSVNISKLRHVMENMEGLELAKKDGYWKIDIQTSKLHVDYLELVRSTENGRISPENLYIVLSLVKKGAFLVDTYYDWLDKIKSEVTNAILDLFFDYVAFNKETDHDLNIKIADAMFVHDSLSEGALKIKYNALVALGRHHLARTILEQFKSEYRSLYGETFNESLN